MGGGFGEAIGAAACTGTIVIGAPEGDVAGAGASTGINDAV